MSEFYTEFSKTFDIVPHIKDSKTFYYCSRWLLARRFNLLLIGASYECGQHQLKCSWNHRWSSTVFSSLAAIVLFYNFINDLREMFAFSDPYIFVKGLKILAVQKIIVKFRMTYPPSRSTVWSTSKLHYVNFNPSCLLWKIFKTIVERKRR